MREKKTKHKHGKKELSNKQTCEKTPKQIKKRVTTVFLFSVLQNIFMFFDMEKNKKKKNSRRGKITELRRTNPKNFID